MRYPPRARSVTRLGCEALEDRVTPVTAFALSGTNLLSFDTASPAVTQVTNITGVTAGETLVGIDFRPQNGLLYGLGVNATANTATLYAISSRTGFAAPVSTAAGAVAFTTDGATAVDLPDPATAGYGFDFDPAADRVRVTTSTGLNFRVDPNTGAPVDGDNGGGATSGVNPDGAINGAPGVGGAAYTNNAPNGNVTTLYTLDSSTGALLIQNPPSAGTVTLVGPTGVSFTAVNGFDIPAGVNDDVSGSGVAAGSGFAVLNVGGTTGLYTVDLTNGQATFLGNVANGATAIQGFTVQSDLGGFPAIALGATGSSLLRFNTSSPATVSAPVPVTGLVGSEILVGIDYRPATGQLYGLGYDATFPTTGAATLYIVDPQTGAATVVGVAGSLAPVGPVNFTGATSFGFDFDPTVDRLRITTNNGLNLRVSPIDGSVTQDTAINGSGVTGVTAAAYTNSTGTGGTPTTPVGSTTLYTLDATTDALYIQNPVNGGTQTAPRTVTLGGATLDFTDVNAFDIPAFVRVAASNAAVASGSGYAVLTVGGTTGLYRIDLTTGAATALGNVGTGSTALAGFALADAPTGTVAFTSATASIGEGGGTLTVNLTRTGSTNGELTVTVNVTGGTALAGLDFTGAPFTATFADGATSTSFNVPIVNDTIFEGNETIVLTIAGVNNAGVIGSANAATVTITENDAQPTYNVTDASGYALGSDGATLFSLSTTNPAAAISQVAVTGVTAGETLVGIDFRPQNGLLYGLGVNPTADTATLYLISPQTGRASVVGAAGGIAFVDGSGNPVDLPEPTAVGYDIDFNPAADRLRVVAGALNFRVDPNSGAPVDGNLNSGTPAGTNPDGAISGATANVNGTAYTNNYTNNGGVTTQYTLDPVTDALYIQNAPNAGTQTVPLTITLGGAPLDFTAVRGFDILAGVSAAVSNAAPTAGTGFAILTVGLVDSLYRIDLTTGAATLVGPILSTPSTYRSLALQSDLGTVPVIGLSASGTQLLRATSPSAVFAVPITGVAAGETLVGIDFRPETGQLFGLGVNATANTATLYRLDPQTGAAIAIGTPGQIALTTDGTTAVDLPDPATAGYGFDFNPTVDRVRVTTSTGLNFRVDPNTGAPIDGDNGGATGSVTGTNPDAAINGSGVTGVGAAAYTNSSATGGTPSAPAGVTTLYTLDAASNSLAVQNPANGGTQTALVPVTLNGAALDFTAVNGFDIPGTVRAGTSNAAVPSGTGYAVLTVGGTTSLYAIDLVTGAATDLGAFGTGAAALAGLTVAGAPAGTISFGSTTYTATEGGPAAVVALTRTGGSSGEVTVVVRVTGGTATPGVDTPAAQYTVTFPDGVTAVTLNLPVTDDTVVEGAETLIFGLLAPTAGVALGTLATATLTISDNDVAVPGPVASGPNVVITRPDGTTATVVPYAGFNGRVTTASGDVNGDGVADAITGAGINGHVKVFDGTTGAEIRSFLAFTNFPGGVYVGAGDVNNDGFDDVIVGATINGHVKVFSGATGAELYSFFAFPGFPGEVRVAGGDVNGDGFDDIIAGAGINGHVKVFSGATGGEIRSFFAYPGFTGGVNVGAGDVDGDGRVDIVTGADASGHVKVFSGATGGEIRSFFAYPGFSGSARVAARDTNRDGFADIIVGSGPGRPATVRTFDGVTLQLLSEVATSDPLNLGIFVG